MFHSVGGGTGSGFGTLLMERLSMEYAKKDKINYLIYSSPQYLNSVVEPYNTVLSTHALLEHSDGTILYDNESLYKVTEKLGIENANYTNLNKIIALTASSIIGSFKNEGEEHQSMRTMLTNLVPYPRIHFLQTSYSPFIPTDSFYLYNPSVS